jgi:hypothetical protein
MTTFNTHAYTDLNARGRQMRKARDTADAEVWKLTDLMPHLAARIAPDSINETSKSERRSTVRRIVDYLRR